MTKPEARLSTIGLAHVTRWLAKTAFVVGFSELGARKFMTNDRESVIPDYTLAEAFIGVTLSMSSLGPLESIAATHFGEPEMHRWNQKDPLVSHLVQLTCWRSTSASYNCGSLFQLLNPTNFGCHRASRDSIRIQNGGR